MGNIYDDGAAYGKGGPYDQDDREPYRPIYRSNLPQGVSKMLLHYIKQQMGAGGANAEQQFRARAFQDIGNQQMQANMAARQGITAGFGGNNPTGLLPGVMAQNALQAPYGAANAAAKEAGIRSMTNLGQIGQNTRTGAINQYVSKWGPALQWRSLDITEQQIAAQQAMAAAAAGGGSGGGGFL